MPSPIYPAHQPLESPLEAAEAPHIEAQPPVGPQNSPRTASPEHLTSPADFRRQAPNSNHLSVLQVQDVAQEEPSSPQKKFPLLHTWLHQNQEQDELFQEDIMPARQSFVDLFIEKGGYEKDGRLYYPESLRLSRTFLDELPPQLTVQGDLRLSNCYKLSSIPTDLEVDGSLNIAKCVEFRRLSGSPNIQANLNVSHCSFLQYIALDDDAHIGGHLLAKDSSSLQGIECAGLQGPLVALRLNELAEIEPILFTTSEESEAEDETPAQRMNPSPPRVYLLDSTLSYGELLNFTDERERVITDGALCMSRNPEGQFGTAQFKTLKDGINFWNVFASSPLDHNTLQYLSDEQKENLSKFLLHLTSTSDFSQLQSLDKFADRIFNFIQFVDQHPNLQDELLQSIDHANQGCGDRAIQSLSQLELTMQIEHAREDKNPKRALFDLALGLIKLDVVHKAAFQRIGEFSASETSELLLRFETELADTLDLPLLNRTMLYPGIIIVDQADFTQVAEDAIAAAADLDTVADFLAQWEPWQMLQRQDSAKKIVWHELESVQVPTLKDECCLITMADLHKAKQPVTVLNEAGYFDLKPLLTWWSEKGTHPISRNQLSLNDVRRVIDDQQVEFKSRLRNKRAPSVELNNPTQKAAREVSSEL